MTSGAKSLRRFLIALITCGRTDAATPATRPIHFSSPSASSAPIPPVAGEPDGGVLAPAPDRVDESRSRADRGRDDSARQRGHPLLLRISVIAIAGARGSGGHDLGRKVLAAVPDRADHLRQDRRGNAGSEADPLLLIRLHGGHGGRIHGGFLSFSGVGGRASVARRWSCALFARRCCALSARRCCALLARWCRARLARRDAGFVRRRTCGLTTSQAGPPRLLPERHRVQAWSWVRASSRAQAWSSALAGLRGAGWCGRRPGRGPGRRARPARARDLPCARWPCALGPLSRSGPALLLGPALLRPLPAPGSRSPWRRGRPARLAPSAAGSAGSPAPEASHGSAHGARRPRARPARHRARPSARR